MMRRLYPTTLLSLLLAFSSSFLRASGHASSPEGTYETMFCNALLDTHNHEIPGTSGTRAPPSLRGSRIEAAHLAASSNSLYEASKTLAEALYTALMNSTMVGIHGAAAAYTKEKEARSDGCRK